MSKPVFVLVPGAFHLFRCLDQLAQQLREAGYDSQSTTLKSVGDADKSLTDDIAHLRNDVLLPLVEGQGQDVILVLHSYAGFPGSVAIKDLSKADRRAGGLEGGIVGVIYMCAFIPKEGDDLRSMVGGQWAPWQAPDEKAGLIMVPDPHAVFYADVAEPLASQSTAMVKGQSMRSFLEAAPPVGYAASGYDGRRAYIRTENDQAIPAFVQDLMLKGSGVEWTVKEMTTGHSPFLAIPKELAILLGELTNGFPS